MSSPLTVKRRRLNDASNTLSKPFRSPLKPSKSDDTPLRSNSIAANIPYQPSTYAHTTKAPTPLRTSVSSTLSEKSVHASTPVRKNQTSTFPAYSYRLDPEEKAAQKAISSLDLQIRVIKNELDTLNQASRILNSTSDADLEDLAQKWRLASQAAAEEIFGSVKERVCRMGGVAAWRESEKRKHDRSNGFGEFKEEPEEDDDRDCEFDSEGEELPEAEQEYRKREKKKALQEKMDAADDGGHVEQEVMKEEKPKVWQEAVADDDVSYKTVVLVRESSITVQQAFTMDMMLRSVNIELDVIGYDKVAQRWIA